MAKKDPYAGSPYDASGMPLGAETVDYDVQEDVAAKTVFDKPVEEPMNLMDIDYTPREIDPKLIRKPLNKRDFNSAIGANVNSGHPDNDVEKIDFEEVTLVNDDPKAIKKAVEEGDTSFLDEEKGKK